MAMQTLSGAGSARSSRASGRAIGLGVLFILAIVCASWPTTSRADGDLEGDVYPELISRTISDALAPELAKSGATVTGVSLSRVDDTTLHFSVALVVFVAELPMAIEANLSETCDADGPALWVSDVVVNPLVADLGMITEEDIAAFQQNAQATVDAQVTAIVEPLWMRLSQIKNEAIARQVCPHIVVQPDGMIHAELHFINGCINGQHFHRECGANQTGNGIDHYCENGLKVLTEHDCRPNGTERP